MKVTRAQRPWAVTAAISFFFAVVLEVVNIAAFDYATTASIVAGALVVMGFVAFAVTTFVGKNAQK